MKISKGQSILIYILVALFLCFEMAVQVSPSLMVNQLMQDFSIGAFGLGLLSGVYYYSYTFMQIPAGMLYDRFNIRVVIVSPLLICCLGVFAFAQAEHLWLATAARLLMGAGSAFAFIAVLVVAADVFDKKYFALMAGITQMLAAFGAMGGELIINPIIQHIGWRSTMSRIALFGVVLAVLIWIFVRYEKCMQYKETTTQVSVWVGLKRIIIKPQTWLIALYACVLWAPMAAFASLWGVPYLEKAFQLSTHQAAVLISVMWLGLAIASPLLGFWSDAVRKRKLPLLVSALVGLFGFGFLVLPVAYPFWIVVIFVLFAGAACAGQALTFAVIKDISAPQEIASAIGFNNMAVVVAGAIFQPLIGKLIQWHAEKAGSHAAAVLQVSDYRFGLWLLPACFLIGSILSLFFIRESVAKQPLEIHAE